MGTYFLQSSEWGGTRGGGGHRPRLGACALHPLCQQTNEQTQVIKQNFYKMHNSTGSFSFIKQIIIHIIVFTKQNWQKVSVSTIESMKTIQNTCFKGNIFNKIYLKFLTFFHQYVKIYIFNYKSSLLGKFFLRLIHPHFQFQCNSIAEMIAVSKIPNFCKT